MSAATNDLSGLLQRGLFEEEANRNLDAAAQAYQTVSAQFDKDRKLAATAIFRLGEIYRKQAKTNEATAQYERIVREFADQDTLVTLSRQNLAGLGATAPANPARTEELQRQQLEQQVIVDELESLVAQVKKLDRHELRRVLPKVSPDPLLAGLMDEVSLAQKNYAILLQNPGASSPQTKAQATKLDQLDKLVDERVDGVVAGLERRLVNTRSQLESLNAQAAPVRSVGAVAPLSRTSRLEQKRLLGEEIKLTEQDLADIKEQVATGQAPQSAPREKEREILKLRRQLAALDVTAGETSTGEDAPTTDEEEAEIRRIQAMIHNSPDLVNAASGQGEAKLFQAAMKGQLRVASFLLDLGAAVNATTRTTLNGWTPLMAAANGGHKKMVELLAERGADVNARDNNGQTALHLAAGRGYLSVAEALVQRKADLNARSKKEYEGATPIHRAATQGHPEMVAFLISSGAEVDARDAAGMTALTRAAMHGYTEVLNKLLDASAKPDIEDQAGLTALGYAAMRGHLDSVKMLLVRAKADPNSGKAGATLFWAISKSECMKLLLEAGAKPNIKRDDGQTPLLTAAEKGDYESALLLIKHGADVNLSNDNRMTPLQMAVWSESIPIVSLLLTNHAEVNAIGPARRNALIMAQEAEARSRPVKPGDYGGSVREANELIARKIAALLREHGAHDQVTNKP